MNQQRMMHPAATERARFLKFAVAGMLLMGVAWSTTGCTSGPPSTPLPGAEEIDTLAASTAPRDSVLALLGRMQRTAFDSAFARLDGYTVTRRVCTEQLDSTGAVTASATRTIAYAPGAAGTLRRADSTGTFRRGGLLSGIAPPQAPRARPANLATQALADQPAYLAPRTQEAYRYALRPGALPGGTPVLIVEATARSHGRGAEQGIRYARLTLDRASHELVGLTVVRNSRILLFEEQSRLTLRLRPVDVGPGPAVWLPRRTRMHARVDVPFRPPRQFRTVSVYSEYDRPQTPS
jgi:hypothetical protein